MGVSWRVVATLLFGSGFSALVYQTAWQRMFRLTFGASTAASAAVLAIFLGGLGLGGALLGPRVERSTKPLMFYGNLELGISALAAASPLLGDLTHRLYLALGGSQALGAGGATLARLVLTALVIGPAAVLMGGTLPAAARAVVTEADAARRSLALLYSLNTIGAVLGALVGPVLLFGLLGNRMTLWGAVCINLLVGVSARALGRAGAELPPSTSDAATSSAPPPASTPLDARLAYFAAGLVGFVFLGLELVWYRVLTPVLGGSSLTFGVILACALSGIGLGGYLFSRRPATEPVTLQLLAVTLALEAVGVLAPFAWGDQLALVAAHLRPMVNLGFSYLIAGWIFVAGCVVLPASIVSGYQFPALFALIGRGREQVAKQVGRAYAFNTLGTLSGSLLVGLVLLPSVGAVALWRGLAQALALLGCACAGFALYRGDRLRSALLPGALGVLALLLSFARGPGTIFRHAPIGAGRRDVATLTPNQIVAEIRARDRTVVWSRDGVESTVGIDVGGGVAFLVNGKSDGAVFGDRGTQAFLGLLPAALHGHVKSAFVVGLGTGMTSGILAKVPGVERVDVAELEPSVKEVARRAALANEAVLDNPKVHLLIGDGRELLLTSPRRYDLILSEPSNPYRAGVASLFTVEFYTAAASRLEQRGLFAQWLQGYEMDARTAALAIRSMRAVFPHVSLWCPEGNDLYLIGSFEPQVVDTERLTRDLQQPAYLKWLRRAWGMEGPEALLAHALAPPPVLERLAKSIAIEPNTDDINALEFAFARTVGDSRYSIMSDLFATLSAIDYRPALTGTIDWKRVEELRGRMGWATPGGPRAVPARARAVSAGCDEGSIEHAKRLWPPDVEPSDIVEVWVRGYIAALTGEAEAARYADLLEAQGFVSEALLLRERSADAHGDSNQAVALLLRALEELRTTALPLCDASARAIRRSVTLAQKHPDRAAELLRALRKAPFAVYADETNRQLGLLAIAQSAPKLCLEGLDSFRDKPVWLGNVLQLRAECLKRVGAPDAAAAEADLVDFLEREPASFATANGAQPTMQAPTVLQGAKPDTQQSPTPTKPQTTEPEGG
jgi:spermidine synthase